jgi:hypothetical protein
MKPEDAMIKDLVSTIIIDRDSFAIKIAKRQRIGGSLLISF